MGGVVKGVDEGAETGEVGRVRRGAGWGGECGGDDYEDVALRFGSRGGGFGCCAGADSGVIEGTECLGCIGVAF